ncbi:MAG: ribosome assembly cofactor RimP [Prevotella sp.]|nr:ribosome assembly cofactor RimP [Bacteroides sp.]MCM1366046.1 ribosome assembly cofactor RimP [Prevotella sp.]MCM1436884.1 ribosome assembly cofactor RimP [Prevotella sp.]
MIDSSKLRDFIENSLEGSGNYLVDLKVSPTNEITVEIDNDEGVDIDECISLTHAIEGEFNRDVEDYELEVGSSGLTSPFKVVRQYRKNLGNPVVVLTKDGRKLHGILRDVTDSGFTIVQEEKIKKPGEKRPVIEEVEYPFDYQDVKSVVYDLKF